MNNLEQLTASKNLCEQLVELGINPVSFLWHSVEIVEGKKDEEGNPLFANDVCLLVEPEYKEGENIPAWTKAELDVMIGPVYAKVDLLTDEETTKNMDRYQYAVFFVNKMMLFKNGAEATAHGLIFLLQNKMIDAMEASERYSKLFTPEQKEL